MNIQDNTLQEHRRLLRHREPAARRGRRNHGDDSDAGSQRRSGRRADQVRDAVGRQQFTGSGYYYYRSDKLNANTWFNNRAEIAKTRLRQKQMGVRAGGPILIPGLFDGRNKAFFFVNYEEVRQPGRRVRATVTFSTRSRSRASSPISRPGGGAAGQPAGARRRQRPDVDGRSTRCQPPAGHSKLRVEWLGPAIDANLERFRYNVAISIRCTLPNDTHRLQHHRQAPLQQRVQLPALQYQPRHAEQPRCTVSRISSRGEPGLGALCVSNSLRSTLGANIVNEVLVAWSGAPVTFFREFTADMWGGTSVADQAAIGSSSPPRRA